VFGAKPKAADDGKLACADTGSVEHNRAAAAVEAVTANNRARFIMRPAQ
jgi:hypothetical protein